MLIEISDCYDCGLPCRRELCPHYRLVVRACDVCGEYGVELHESDGREVCSSCDEEDEEDE